MSKQRRPPPGPNLPLGEDHGADLQREQPAEQEPAQKLDTVGDLLDFLRTIPRDDSVLVMFGVEDRCDENGPIVSTRRFGDTLYLVA